MSSGACSTVGIAGLDRALAGRTARLDSGFSKKDSRAFVNLTRPVDVEAQPANLDGAGRHTVARAELMPNELGVGAQKQPWIGPSEPLGEVNWRPAHTIRSGSGSSRSSPRGRACTS